jgi:hypothetical protein
VTSENALGNAGYAITGSGGGGSGGKYVFASLEELDSIITDWTEILGAIRRDGDVLRQVQYVVASPAEDVMSKQQSAALGDSIAEATRHNDSMSTYAESYIAKLNEARAEYLREDDSAARSMKHANES